MSLIYITGAPGSGKSTIQHALQDRGIEAYDIDTPTFGGPHNKKTGERVTIPPAEERTAAWFDEHEWRVIRPSFEKMKELAGAKDIVICGVAESDTEVIDLFDKILYLSLEDDTLRQRLAAREGNDYGKNPFELETILERKHRLDKRYLLPSVVTIDASLPLDKVVDTIMSEITPQPQHSQVL